MELLVEECSWLLGWNGVAQAELFLVARMGMANGIFGVPFRFGGQIYY